MFRLRKGRKLRKQFQDRGKFTRVLRRWSSDEEPDWVLWVRAWLHDRLRFTDPTSVAKGQTIRMFGSEVMRYHKILGLPKLDSLYLGLQDTLYRHPELIPWLQMRCPCPKDKRYVNLLQEVGNNTLNCENVLDMDGKAQLSSQQCEDLPNFGYIKFAQLREEIAMRPPRKPKQPKSPPPIEVEQEEVEAETEAQLLDGSTREAKLRSLALLIPAEKKATKAQELEWVAATRLLDVEDLHAPGIPSRAALGLWQEATEPGGGAKFYTQYLKPFNGTAAARRLGEQSADPALDALEDVERLSESIRR
jgi:hypothetical protein